VFFETF